MGRDEGAIAISEKADAQTSRAVQCGSVRVRPLGNVWKDGAAS